MLNRLGRFTVRRRRLVLAATAVLVVAAALLGGGVADRLSTGGFENDGFESTRARLALEAEFDTSEPNVVVLVTARSGSVDDPALAEAGRVLTAELASETGVSDVVSYWSLGSTPPLRSEDGRRALVLGVIEGSDAHVQDVIEALSPRYHRADGVATIEIGGRAELYRQVDEQIGADLTRAETLALPITLLLLVLVFGGLVAAGLPLLVGVLAIVGSLAALAGIASITEVSIYSLNLTTAMGLGLAIDYSLFVVSRFREEIGRGLSTEDAVVRTVETAGHTVAGSALTVAVSLAALLVFPLPFLRSFAYAGVAVSVLAASGAIVFLPALLAVLGPRVDRLRLWRRDPKPVGEGVWHRVATFVMRRPLTVAVAVVGMLVVLGIPFLRVQLGLPDDRVLSATMSSRQVQDVIRGEFTSNEAGALPVVALSASSERDTAAIDRYATELSRLDGVARVDASTGSYVRGARFDAPSTERFVARSGTWLSVVPSVEPLSDAGERLAHRIRDLDSPLGPVLVGGRSAELVDAKAALFERLPWAAAWIAIATFVLLFLMFGSLVVPLKALVLNVLSLSATFGAMVWVFQDGHLASLLGFTATGTLTASMPILMFCVAFGLSMDYEVFLLSRIKEEHDRTGDNVRSVAMGLERTGRIVTAAAVTISVVFLAFATSGVSFIKLFGLGLALAVLMDAFVIRATLVPAFMRLAGDVNWWAPRWMRRIADRAHLGEMHDATPPPERTMTSAPLPDPDRAPREPVSVS